MLQNRIEQLSISTPNLFIMSAICFCSYETIETINSTLFKVEIDNIRKKLPHLKDKSDEEIIEEVKDNSITFEDLDLSADDEEYDENNSLKGDDMSNSLDSDVYSSDELKKSSFIRIYQMMYGFLNLIFDNNVLRCLHPKGDRGFSQFAHFHHS